MKRGKRYLEAKKLVVARWEKEEAFKAVDFHPIKPKFYVLYEFPNISGNIHMGHLKGVDISLFYVYNSIVKIKSCP